MLVNKLVEECTENIEETRLVETASSKNENKHKCGYCTLYIFFLFFLQLTLQLAAIFFAFTVT